MDCFTDYTEQKTVRVFDPKRRRAALAAALQGGAFSRYAFQVGQLFLFGVICVICGPVLLPVEEKLAHDV